MKKETKTTKEFKPQPETLYKVANKETVRRGFLLAFVEFVAKKGTVTAAELIAEFHGRQIDGHKVTPLRVRRYVSYCVSHEIFKKAGTR